MKNKIKTDEVKALLKFIVAGYFCDILSKNDKEEHPIELNITGNEKEMLKMVAEGLSDEEIAKKLVTTKDNIQTEIDKIFAKLENQDRTKDAVLALKGSLIPSF